MNIFELAFLSIVQGITEFLPVSSSAHLILGRETMVALGLASGHMTSAQELAFDIALHIGSLGAVLIYFRNEMTLFIRGLLDLLRGRYSHNAALLILTTVASIPIVIVALIFKDLITHSGRSIGIVAWSTLLFGLLLWVADRRRESKAGLHELTLRDCVTIGLAQCLAVIPGVSRSGICMTAGRFIGLDRTLSARFAMLLSIPTILGAGLLASVDLARAGKRLGHNGRSHGGHIRIPERVGRDWFPHALVANPELHAFRRLSHPTRHYPFGRDGPLVRRGDGRLIPPFAVCCRENVSIPPVKAALRAEGERRKS